VHAVLSLSVHAPAAGAARLVLGGHLDDEGARDVLHAAADVVRCGCARLVVDLDAITSYDDDAAFAVLGCWRLARFLPDGVVLVAEQATGRALADEAGVPAQGIMGACPAC
jgi:hypothetical protein